MHAPTAEEEEALAEKHGLVMQIIFKRRELAEKKKKLDDKEKYVCPRSEVVLIHAGNVPRPRQPRLRATQRRSRV